MLNANRIQSMYPASACHVVKSNLNNAPQIDPDFSHVML